MELISSKINSVLLINRFKKMTELRKISVNKNRTFFCLIITAAMFAAVISSCKKDSDSNGNGNGNSNGNGNNSITISVENGSAYSSEIDKVKLEAFDVTLQKEVALATVDYGNGTFTVNLPATVDAKYMYSIGYISEGITVSNNKAKAVNVNISAYKEDEFKGTFYFGKVIDAEKNLRVDGYLAYVDSYVTITGTCTKSHEAEGNIFEYVEIYTESLKKGWNFMYNIVDVEPQVVGNKTTITIKHTTTDPGGMKWYTPNLFIEY